MYIWYRTHYFLSSCTVTVIFCVSLLAFVFLYVIHMPVSHKNPCLLPYFPVVIVQIASLKRCRQSSNNLRMIMIYTVMLSIYFVQHTVKYMELNIFIVLYQTVNTSRHRITKPTWKFRVTIIQIGD